MRSAETIDLDFQNLWALLKRRWLPAISVFSTVLAIAIIADLLQKPVYQAQGKLLLKKVDQTSALTGLGEKIGQLNGVNLEKSDPLKTEAEVLVSTPLLQETINLLNLKDKKGKLLKPEKLAQQLKVKQLPEADVLQTSYKSTNPREAAAVVNTLMNIYIENNVLTNRAEAVAAARFINNQLPETETTVRQAELALRLFKEQNHVIDLDEESKSAVAVIQELQTQINQTQVELAGANAKLADLQNKVGRASQQAITINSLNQSAGVQKVLEEFQRVESELALQRTRFQEDYPTIVDLRLKETALRALLQNRVERDAGPARPIPSEDLQIGESKQKLLDNLVISESDRSSLVSRLAKLYEAQSIYKQRVNILPKLEQEQRELKRQVEAAQSTYETLLKKLQEVRVAENQNMGNARIIESALVPEKASIRNKILILGLGCMLGILLSGATVAILEVTDTSIKTLEQARELFGYTLVGVIPSLKKKATHRGKATEWTVPELPVRDTPHLPICEAYRMLQANLKFLSSDKALKVIVVTSSVPNEGKSKVSANLVATMAQLGRRVLLVDADMRHPTQHHIWGLTNAVGLSDVIIGQCEFEVAVKEVMANLDVLPSGGIPPSPLALLDSKRMASLIENFAKTYDFVALDAPPLTVADALTLGKMTDGVLLLARLGVVDFTSAATAKRTLECLGQNVLGLVVNDVNLENEYYIKYPSALKNSAIRQEDTYKPQHI